MPEFRIVAVRPLYGGNLGSIARAMKNFGSSELVLVDPQAKPDDREAVRLSKHALDILQGAKVANTIAQACAGCDFAVATTGVTGRFSKKIKNCVTPDELRARIGGKEKVALVFGSEGTGLTDAELAACDCICSIPASKQYPVLNLSHAVAVMLYSLASEGRRFNHYRRAGGAKSRQLARMFSQLAGGLEGVRDVPKVARAFRNIVSRGRPADDEAQALFAVLSALLKREKKRKSEKTP